MNKQNPVGLALVFLLVGPGARAGGEFVETSFYRHGQVIRMVRDTGRLTLPLGPDQSLAQLQERLAGKGIRLDALEMVPGRGVGIAELTPADPRAVVRELDLPWAGPVFFSGKATTLPTGRIWIFAGQDPDLESLGLVLVERPAGLHRILVVRPAGACADIVELSRRLHQEHGLDAVPELMRRVYSRYTPDDTHYPLQWPLNNTGDNVTGAFSGQPIAGTAGADIQAGSAWDQTLGSASSIVGVIDSGVDCDHPDLAGKCGAELNAITNLPDASPPDPGSDYGAGHGTSVASVAAAKANSLGVVGVCPECGIVPVRLIEQATYLTDAMMLRAFVHAVDEGAVVINNSWGPVGSGFFIPVSTGELEGIEYAGAHEVLVVYAAGNENQSTDFLGHLQTGYAHVLAVAASDQFDLKSEYSNFGPHISLCAPSSDVYLDPAVYAAEIQGNGNVDSDWTSAFGGTSSAAPVVSGVAALVISVAPQLTAAEVVQILYDSADKIDPDGGWYDPDGHSIKYGYGRVNALRAVLMAQNLPDRPWCETPAAEEDCLTHIDDNCDGFVNEGCGLAPSMGMLCTDASECGAAPNWECPSAGPQQGVCTWVCTDQPCPPGSTCLNGRCSRECQRGSDCEPGFVCSNTQLGVCLQACASDADCGPDEICDPDTQLCQLATDGQIGSPCAAPTDCVNGGFCLSEAMGFPDGYCTLMCSSHADCGSGDFPNRCVFISGMGNFCYRGCSFDGDCRQSYLCMQAGPRAGTCYKHCARDDQCTGGDPQWDTIVCDVASGRCIDTAVEEDGGPDDGGEDGGVPDAQPDAGTTDEDLTDAGADAGSGDQPADLDEPDGADESPDAGVDAGVDAGTDAGSDAGADPGEPSGGEDGCGCASSGRRTGSVLLVLLLFWVIRRKAVRGACAPLTEG